MELFSVTQLASGYGALPAKLDGITIGLSCRKWTALHRVGHVHVYVTLEGTREVEHEHHRRPGQRSSPSYTSVQRLSWTLQQPFPFFDPVF